MGIGAGERQLHAISGLAHEARVADGMTQHSTLPNPRIDSLASNGASAQRRRDKEYLMNRAIQHSQAR
jgi:hypothetical protein